MNGVQAAVCQTSRCIRKLADEQAQVATLQFLEPFVVLSMFPEEESPPRSTGGLSVGIAVSWCVSWTLVVGL